MATRRKQERASFETPAAAADQQQPQGYVLTTVLDTGRRLEQSLVLPIEELEDLAQQIGRNGINWVEGRAWVHYPARRVVKVTILRAEHFGG